MSTVYKALLGSRTLRNSPMWVGAPDRVEDEAKRVCVHTRIPGTRKRIASSASREALPDRLATAPKPTPAAPLSRSCDVAARASASTSRTRASTSQTQSDPPRCQIEQRRSCVSRERASAPKWNYSTPTTPVGQGGPTAQRRCPISPTDTCDDCPGYHEQHMQLASQPISLY